MKREHRLAPRQIVDEAVLDHRMMIGVAAVVVESLVWLAWLLLVVTDDGRWIMVVLPGTPIGLVLGALTLSDRPVGPLRREAR